MTMRIYLLLLFALLACDGENTIREPAPDLPVIDIGAYDSDRAYFVYQIESDRSVDRDIYPRIVMTYRGHFENDRFRRFEFRTAKYGRIIAGLQEYHAAAHRTIDASMGWYTEFSGVELPFKEGERGIVSSVVVEISQPPPHRKWILENGNPYIVGISTVMFTTHQNIVRR